LSFGPKPSARARIAAILARKSAPYAGTPYFCRPGGSNDDRGRDEYVFDSLLPIIGDYWKSIPPRRLVLINLLTITSLIFASYTVIRIFRIKKPIEIFFFFYVTSFCFIVVWGYVLSELGEINNLLWWMILSIITATASFALRLVAQRFQARFTNDVGVIDAKILESTWLWFTHETSRFEKFLISPLLFSVIVIFLISLVTAIFVAPHNWDSMTYHLARVAYYLQNGNLNYFDANYWAQVVHPKNSALVLLFVYLVGGENENLTQIVQLCSYIVAVFSIYGISRLLDFNKTESIFAALVSALLVEWLMQATTTQNDMMLTALTGVSVYCLLRYRASSRLIYLAFVALAIALGLGVKTSYVLVIPSIALIALYSFAKPEITLSASIRNGFYFIVFLLAALSVLTLPSGLLENYNRFGHPVGPETVVSNHAFSSQTEEYIIHHGTKNLLRYMIEFTSLDGLYPIAQVRRMQEWIRYPAVFANHRLGLDLESTEATRAYFNLEKKPTSHEDASYWGIWGFGLVFVAVLISLSGFVRNNAVRIMAFATLLFFLAQSYSGPYDPWRGRYFVICAIFSVPLAGLWLRINSDLIRFCLAVIITIGMASSFSAVVFRTNSFIFPVHTHGINIESIFSMDRIGQLTRNRNAYSEAIRNFDALVPPFASVAVYLPGDSFEYPLFGEKITRKIIPINSYDKGLQSIPLDADFLLYSKNYPCSSIEDVFLGGDWYLRSLTNSNRICN
jgi:4-amino-4-deoxy-L-arabinose transferase-like glycosyltransferase